MTGSSARHRSAQDVAATAAVQVWAVDEAGNLGLTAQLDRRATSAGAPAAPPAAAPSSPRPSGTGGLPATGGVPLAALAGGLLLAAGWAARRTRLSA